MKKITLAASILLALSTQAFADEGKKGDAWVAGFVEAYSTDDELSGAPTFFSDGTNFGGEVGFRFAPQWAARVEYTHLSIDVAQGQEKSGNRWGIDGMYFLPDDLLYLFGGIKELKIDDSNAVFNIGLGKQWAATDKIKIITEIASYNDFDSGFTDIGLKLGIGYSFGESGPAKAKDSDNDGVNDTLDMCPNTAPGTQVDAKGCDIDQDKDGVLNSLDLCPNTPAGTKVNSNGCAIGADADGDGVADADDKCANTPITDKVDAVGCSVFMEEEVSQELKFTFANNSAVIVNHVSDLQAFADFMNRYPNTDTVIEGHASAPGEAAYNLQLSQKRADAVRKLLITKYGIDASRITAVGFGETQLLDTANTPAANAKNRRITAKVSASKRVKVEK